MSKVYAFTAQITRLKRLKNSVNGNPRYQVGFDNARTLKTASDQSCAFNIEGLKGELQVFISKGNQIVDLQPVTKPLLPVSGVGAFEHLARYSLYNPKADLLTGLVFLAEKVHNLDTEAAQLFVENYLKHIGRNK